MVSPYDARVQMYGRGWHRPWLIFAMVLSLFFGVHWLTRPVPEFSQAVCAACGHSRFAAAVNIDGLSWTADLQLALECARKHDRRVFVAFHGICDTNVPINEIMFRDRQVKAAMKEYVLVVLYTDMVPEKYYLRSPTREMQESDADANLKFEVKTFNTIQEPLYLVLQPTSDGTFAIVGEHEQARLNDQPRFLQFLRSSLTARVAATYRGQCEWRPLMTKHVQAYGVVYGLYPEGVEPTSPG